MHNGAIRPGLDVSSALQRVVRERRIADVATVVATSSRARVPLAAKLLVEDEGAVVGTLGSAELDEAVIRDARRHLESRKSEVVAYRFGVETEQEEVEVFHEIIEPRPQLLVVGAGHIAVPLARFGSQLGFEVVVVDDREKFANRERFPDADRVIAAGFGETLRDYPINRSTFVVIITRAHTYDEESLRLILGRPTAYLGMIGSRRRVQTVLRTLAAEGYDHDVLGSVRAPIGLDVGSETPEEIALSIIAEVVAVRRGGTGVPLSQKGRPIAIGQGGRNVSDG
ncbi:MAG TPA: XdhC/CoxI family protein [Chloroflexota bacterium]|nr:XdhC/CoxI family protein [Chloroflexota bacterium]